MNEIENGKKEGGVPIEFSINVFYPIFRAVGFVHEDYLGFIKDVMDYERSTRKYGKK
ncbi:hypothetical protein K8I31_13175 [bacterium]|nr:hypothetical protein [bacterium]